MFGHKAQTPYDLLLGLCQYDCGESISKHSWVQEQYELVRAASKGALKAYDTSTKCSVQRK